MVEQIDVQIGHIVLTYGKLVQNGITNIFCAK